MASAGARYLPLVRVTGQVATLAALKLVILSVALLLRFFAGSRYPGRRKQVRL